MNKFITGFIVGSVANTAALAIAALIYKKQVLDPVEEKWEFIEENRKKAARKRIAP